MSSLNLLTRNEFLVLVPVVGHVGGEGVHQTPKWEALAIKRMLLHNGVFCNDGYVKKSACTKLYKL